MKSLQRGLGAFGTLVIVAIAGVAGYYVYKAVMEPDEAPSCRAALNSCFAKCRRTSTDAPAAQACQDACQSDAAACERKR